MVRAALAKSVAETPEVDLLGSIGSAAATDAGKTLGIVVVGSGLQTTGTLDFAENDLLYGDPASIAQQMDASGDLPTGLKGVTVYWSGITDVAGRQTRLTESAGKNLAAIWSAVLAKAGARLELLPEHLTGNAELGAPGHDARCRSLCAAEAGLD
ncbi:hypothetical protein [Amnibacterium kyonggiense]|uniref:hypothetical protein n=1 Tax=Amnibacterium kyonggiense TaxID=595671 RepID=UPI00105BE547|nr:hypothetical protein [Amnibacterium kyonggiense]